MSKIYIQKIDEQKGRILVFYEKYGNRYFLAETKEQVYDACLKILRERAWMFTEPKEPVLKDTQEGHVFDDGSPFRKLQMEAIKHNEQAVRNYKDRLREYQIAQVALKENRGDFAWAVISERYDYEYERYEFEHLENV